MRIAALLMILGTLPAPAILQKESIPGFAVIELFTSQGCSSCPPADKLLAEIATDARIHGKRVYALSYHVDYWNKLGWKDPFSNPAFARRQLNYASATGGKEVFTPQVFVNGRGGTVGSDRQKLIASRDKALALKAPQALSIRTDSIRRDSLFIGYSSSVVGSDFSLAFAVVQRGVATQVLRGENKGKKLRHENVVRLFHVVPLKARSGQAVMALHQLAVNADFSVYAFVQMKGTRLILAAADQDF